MGQIAWTDKSIGGAALGLYGCSHAGEGCRNCWAEGMASRFEELHGYPEGVVEGGRWTGNVVADVDHLVAGFAAKLPGPRSKVRRVFPWSTADLFHEDVPDEYIREAFRLMGYPYSSFTFQVLTKRPARAATFKHWPSNVWCIYSASTKADMNRGIDDLLQVDADVRGLSLEPLIEDVDLNLTPPGEWPAWCEDCGTDVHPANITHDDKHNYCGFEVDHRVDDEDGLSWVIVGAESGPRRRPCRTEWVRSVVEQCQAAGVPVFVKQIALFCEQAWPSPGTLSHNPAEWPADLRVREFPEMTP